MEGIPQILMTRVDNRLIHGQVVTAWLNHLRANLIVVANDEVAKDPLQQELMSLPVSTTGAGVRFFSIQKTIDVIYKASPKQKILLIVATPQDAAKLLKGGVPLGDVNLGNMHMSPGKRLITKALAVDDDDLAVIAKLKKKGLNVFAQRVPGETKDTLEKVLN